MLKSTFARLTVTLILLQLFGAATGLASEPRPEPSNRLVVMIDGSGTYKKRVAEAVERVVALLDAFAATKVHRWETNQDRVTLISLDALPAVLWEGSVADLKAIDRGAWAKRFQARTDYAACTDVAEAFRLAARALEGNARYTGKYLWVFSDLIDEPPTTSVGKCRPSKQPSLPPQGFPWEALLDVSVSVFWAPPDQALAWKRAVAEHGLENSFVLHATSESGAVEIAPPPRRTVTMTEAEVAETQQELQASVVGGMKSIGKLVGGLLLALVLIVAAIAVPARLRNARSDRRPAPRPAGSRPGGGAPSNRGPATPVRAVPRTPVSGNQRSA